MSDIISASVLLDIGSHLFRLALIVIITVFSLRFIGVVVDHLFMPKPGSTFFYLEERRAKTLTALLKSIIRYSVYFFAGISVLHEFQIDTTSILAGAGILGLAVGFGAQSLVKDAITGFFIILEDQYSVGDYIACGSLAGTVEEVGFRVTKLRDANGILHIIPNGTIQLVSNHTRGHTLAVVLVPVSYEADLDQVFSLLDQICHDVKEELDVVLALPQVLGVVELKDMNLVIKILAQTVPLQQGKVETLLRYKIKQAFEAAEIPRPQFFGPEAVKEKK
ncbi:MAG: mechanosensitive ion channel family protein [Sporomusaceae bacterium]|nr:mechanosensitive ion channel family protein [Sporomusaceae bacterium]